MKRIIGLLLNNWNAWVVTVGIKSWSLLNDNRCAWATTRLRRLRTTGYLYSGSSGSLLRTIYNRVGLVERFYLGERSLMGRARGVRLRQDEIALYIESQSREAIAIMVSECVLCESHMTTTIVTTRNTVPSTLWAAPNFAHVFYVGGDVPFNFSQCWPQFLGTFPFLVCPHPYFMVMDAWSESLLPYRVF